MRTVLVTGGAGYVGSHTCKTLAEAGYNPVTYDNLSRGHRDAVRWGPLVVGDIADRDKLKATFDKYEPEAIVHFAAYTYVGESVGDPSLYYRNNVTGSLALIESAVEAGIRRIVFSSTAATYGTPQYMPLTEEHNTLPINPYGRSKLVVEQMLTDADQAYGLRSVALRYFNAAGADPEGEIGEDHDPETHAIPLAIQAVLGQRPPFQIFGTDYQTRDGTAIRDYVHVMDLASAHVKALEYLARGGASTQVNLGTGTGTSVKELIDAVGAVAGKPVPHQSGPRREGDPAVLVAGNQRARELLGWEPRFQDLSEIVGTAWRWHTVGLEQRRRAVAAA